MSTTVIGGVAYALKELLTGGIQDSLPALDLVMGMMHTEWEEVTQQGIGRSLQVIHTFDESVSGVVRYGPNMGDTMDNTTLTSGTLVDTQDEFPGVEEQSFPTQFQRIVTLAKGSGNIHVPLDYMRMDVLPATITKLVERIVKGTSQQVAMSQITPFYQNHTTAPMVLGTIGAATATDGTAAVTLAVTNIHNFRNGQGVHIWDTTGATRKTTQLWFVDGVTYVRAGTIAGTGTVTLKSGDATETYTAVATDIVVQAGAINDAGASTAVYGPKGPSYWLANSGTVFGVSFTTHPQFHSVVDTSVGELTESALGKYLGRLWHAYGMMGMPDTLITSMGVTQDLLETSGGIAGPRLIRELGDLNKIRMGFGSPKANSYTFNGMELAWIVTPYMPSASTMASSGDTGGIMWGLVTRDQNLKRYVMPGIPGAGSKDNFPKEVDFPFTESGMGVGGFLPTISKNGRVTKFLQAPFEFWIACAPERMQGLALSGINERL